MKKFYLAFAFATFIPCQVKATTAVVSGSTTRHESAVILNYGSSVSIDRQTGPWISSVSRSSTGKVVLTISSGVFADDPICTCTTQSTGVGQCFLDNNVALTPTQVPVGTATGGTLDDWHFHISCQGETE